MREQIKRRFAIAGVLCLLMAGTLAANDAIVPETQADYEDVLVQASAAAEEHNFGDDLSAFASEAGASAGSWGNVVADEQMHDTGWKEMPTMIKKKREIPRRDFKMKQVSRDFCGGPPYQPTKTCSAEYQQSMVMVAFPVFAVAFLALLMGLLIIIGRYCFCCSTSGSGWCGGRLPSQGCCYGDLLESDAGYSTCSWYLYTFFVVFTFLLVCSGMMFGFMGNAKLTTGIAQLLDLAVSTPKGITADITRVQTEMDSIATRATTVNPHLSKAMFTEVTGGLATIKNSTSGLGAMITKSLAPIKKYEGERSAWTYLAFWLPTILVTLGLIGIICPVLNFIAVVPLTAIMAATVLFVLAGHIPIAVITADFCVGLDYGLKHKNSTSPLDMMMTCPKQPPGTAAGLAASFEYFSTTTTNAACLILNTTLCPMPGVSYTTKSGGSATIKPVTCPKGSDGNPLPCNTHTIQTILNQTIVHDFRWGCSALDSAGNIAAKQCEYEDKSKAETGCLKSFGNTNVRPCSTTGEDFRVRSLVQCAGSCLMNTTKLAAYKAVGNEALSGQFGDIYSKQLEPLMQCSFMHRTAIQLEHHLCHGVVHATDYMILALAIISVGLFFGNFIYLGAHKRFHRGYSDENWPETRASLLGEEGPDGTGMPLLGAGRAEP